MIPTKVIEDAMAGLLAADTNTLAKVLPPKVHLIAAAFVPGENLDFTVLTEASFPGYAALAATSGTQQSFNDPTTGDNVVQLLEPAGGWHWQANATVTPNQTIYGYVVTDNASLITYGGQLFSTPIVLAVSGDAIDQGQVRFNIPRGVIS